MVGVMAEVVACMIDDAYDLWVCPTHGIIGEDELREVVDVRCAHAGNPDGSTESYICARDHDGDPPEAVIVNVRSDVERALLVYSHENGQAPHHTWRENIDLANAIRVQNAHTLRAIKSSARTFGLMMVQVIVTAPESPNDRISIGRLLRAPYRMGPEKARTILTAAGVTSADRRVGDLTDRQREIVVVQLGEMIGRAQRSKPGLLKA